MKRRVHFHSPSEISGHLNKQRASGLSVDRYCENERLAVSTFWYWRKRYKDTVLPSVPVTFARLGITPMVPPQGFEVLFENKVMVRVPARFETEALRSLFSALK